MAPCPVCLDHFGERNLVTFDSPQAGWPTHCSEEHYLADEEHHKYVDRLREANEDEHDLRSGRVLAEFENLPGQYFFFNSIQSFKAKDLISFFFALLSNRSTFRIPTVRFLGQLHQLGYLLLH